MATISWVSATNNTFNTASAWSTGTVPGPTDDALIALAGSYTVSVTAAFSVNSLTVSDTSAYFANPNTVTEQIAGNLTNAGSMAIDNEYYTTSGSTVTVGGKLKNTGTLNIGNSGVTANTLVTAASLTNSGTINLSGNFPSGPYGATLNITGAAGFGSAGLLTGTVTLYGNTLLEFGSGQITKIASGAQLNLRGAAVVADAGNTGTSSALKGLTSNAGYFIIGDSETVTTTGAMTNTGNLWVDNQYYTQSGSTLTLGGALTNSNTVNVGNTGLSANSLLQATLLTNTGTINIQGNFPGTYQATLDITGAAGFGTAGVLTGTVNLLGNALLEFASGQITSIGNGAQLALRGAQARVADAGTLATNSALTSLTSNAGNFFVGDSASVTTTVTSTFSNTGTIYVDAQYGGQSGSTLTLGGALNNAGLVVVGNTGMAANDLLKATSLSNTGTIDINSDFPGSYQAVLYITGAAGFGSTGTLSGTVNLLGNTLLEFGTGEVTSIAAGAQLDLRGAAIVADASNTATSTALTGLNANAGNLFIGDSDTVATTATGGFVNSGTIELDAQYNGQGGSNLTLNDTLGNTGTVYVGNGGLSSNDMLKAALLSNTGTINIQGNFGSNGTGGMYKATLDIVGAASFGTNGVLTGAVYMTGNTLLEFGSGEITSISNNATLDMRGAAIFADATNTATSTALTGLNRNLGNFYIGDNETVTTTATGIFSNVGTIEVDAQYNGQGGSTLTLGDTLNNTGTVDVGDGGLNANDLLQAALLYNTGTINISSNFPTGTNQATLDITGQAGFGTLGILTGTVNMTGDTLLEFGSGQITSIAYNARLNLRGQARIADASALTTSSALAGLNANAGTLLIGDNDKVTTTAAGTFNNTGTIDIDNQYNAQGGSTLALGDVLGNSGTIYLGPGNNSLAGNDSITASGLVNTGAITLYGNPGQNSTALLGITGTASNTGSINITSYGLLSASSTYAQYSNGITSIQGAGTLTAGNVIITGGQLQGSGTINGAVSLTGGDTTGGFFSNTTPGTLAINGNLSISGAAVLDEELAGTASNQASKLALSTTSYVSLIGGTVQANVSGFNLGVGNSFTIMSFTSGHLTGVFASLIDGQAAADGSSDDLGNGLTMGLIYGESAGTIQLAVVATPTTTADNWLGGTGNFATAADWDNGVPTFYSNVTIGKTSSGQVTLSSDATIDSLAIAAGNALTDNYGAGFFVGTTAAVASGGTLTVNGTTSVYQAVSNGSVVVGNGTNAGEMVVVSTAQFNGSLLINAHGLLFAEGGGTVSGTVSNAGIIAAAGPTLDIMSAVSGSGTLQINTAGTIELGGATANTVSYNGAGSKLILDAPTTFTGTLSRFAPGDILDLGSTLATGATVSGSNLVVSLQGGGTDSFKLASYTGDGFSLVQNPGGDTAITDLSNTATLTTGTDDIQFFTGTNTVTGGAGTFMAADTITGGSGTDTLNLSGDYSAGVTLGAATLTNFEAINLAAGNSYNLTLNATTDPSGSLLAVGASTLAAPNILTLDASQTAGSLVVSGGSGADMITAGSGTTNITGNGGSDTMNAGSGVDTFNYNSLLDAGTGGDTINGFSLAAPDLLNLHTLVSSFSGETSSNAFSAGYLNFVASGGNTQVMVDADGSAGAGSPVLLATLTNVTLTQANTTNYKL